MHYTTLNSLLGRFARSLGVFHADKGLWFLFNRDGAASQQEGKDEGTHKPILVQPIGMYKYG